MMSAIFFQADILIDIMAVYIARTMPEVVQDDVISFEVVEVDVAAAWRCCGLAPLCGG
jgi:hypothetical protein